MYIFVKFNECRSKRMTIPITIRNNEILDLNKGPKNSYFTSII